MSALCSRWIDEEWQRWANIHIATRQGVGFLEFTPEQAEAAFALIASGLSQRGYDTARDIMRLEGHLADLLDDHVAYGEKRYWLTVMGEPSATAPWGWQLDGHHLVVNFFVLGDQVVIDADVHGLRADLRGNGALCGHARIRRGDCSGPGPDQQPDRKRSASQAIVSPEKTANNNRGELCSGQRGRPLMQAST